MKKAKKFLAALLSVVSAAGMANIATAMCPEIGRETCKAPAVLQYEPGITQSVPFMESLRSYKDDSAKVTMHEMIVHLLPMLYRYYISIGMTDREVGCVSNYFRNRIYCALYHGCPADFCLSVFKTEFENGFLTNYEFIGRMTSASYLWSERRPRKLSDNKLYQKVSDTLNDLSQLINYPSLCRKCFAYMDNLFRKARVPEDFLDFLENTAELWMGKDYRG